MDEENLKLDGDSQENNKIVIKLNFIKISKIVQLFLVICRSVSSEIIL